MYGSHRMPMVIVKQNRDTVCCLDRYAKTWDIGKDGIGVVRATCFRDILNMVGMGLTWQGQWSAGSIGTILIQF
jgi:hypothetical protein